MIEFRVDITRRSFDVEDDISNAFKYPLVAYFFDKEDKRDVLYTFVIVDYANKELIYIHSCTEENIEILKSHLETNTIRMNVKIANPHCVLRADREGSFYVFLEGEANFFLYVDRKNDKMRLFFAKDFPAFNDAKIESFGETFYKDDEDENYFYLSARGNRGGESQGEVFFFRASMDMADIRSIFQTTSFDMPVAHMTRKFKDFLLNSEFDVLKYRFNPTGEIVSRDIDRRNCVYRKLFHDFCIETGAAFSEEYFSECCKIQAGWDVMLNLEFKLFCDKKGGHWRDVSKSNKEYSFSPMPGNFTVINLKNNGLRRYFTTFCRPGHFEIDANNNFIYTSSHNFVHTMNKLHYFGPSAIDKFVISADGEVEKLGTFTHPTGYRFTTHRFFMHKGKSYFCTMGFPNRIFFVDADTMNLIYHDDLGTDFLSEQKDVAGFLNNTDFAGLNMRAFDVSANGEFVSILNKSDMYVYSFSEKRVVYQFSLYPQYPLEGDVFLSREQFRNRTTHLGYLI